MRGKIRPLSPISNNSNSLAMESYRHHACRRSLQLCPFWTCKVVRLYFATFSKRVLQKTLHLIYKEITNRFFLFFSYFLCVSFDTLFDIFIPFKCYCTQSVPKRIISPRYLFSNEFFTHSLPLQDTLLVRPFFYIPPGLFDIHRGIPYAQYRQHPSFFL